MRFDFRHRFDCSADTLWEILMDEDYQDEAAQVSGTTKELLEDRTEFGRRTRRTRVTPQRELPPAMARALGTDTLSYVQEQRWQVGKTAMSWVVIPDIFANRVTCKGDYLIAPRGPTSCERVITGEMRIGVPVVGGRMEKRTVEDLQKSYDATAVLLQQWVAKRA